jgi:hypothetical protein
MANALYGLGREGFLQGSIDWDANTIKVVLVDSSDYSLSIDTDQFLDDIAAAGQIAISDALGSKTETLGVADAADITLTAVSGSQFEYIILFADSGDSSTSPLICCIDSATGLPCTPNGGDITIQFDSGANKIFKL